MLLKRPSGVELDHLPVRHGMLATARLALESRVAPQPRIAKRPREVLVDQPRHVVDRLPPCRANGWVRSGGRQVPGCIRARCRGGGRATAHSMLMFWPSM
jgi:hypothetical protein